MAVRTDYITLRHLSSCSLLKLELGSGGQNRTDVHEGQNLAAVPATLSRLQAAGEGVEPSTFGVRVRCAANCATRQGGIPESQALSALPRGGLLLAVSMKENAAPDNAPEGCRLV